MAKARSLNELIPHIQEWHGKEFPVGLMQNEGVVKATMNLAESTLAMTTDYIETINAGGKKFKSLESLEEAGRNVPAAILTAIKKNEEPTLEEISEARRCAHLITDRVVNFVNKRMDLPKVKLAEIFAAEKPENKLGALRRFWNKIFNSEKNEAKQEGDLVLEGMREKLRVRPLADVTDEIKNRAGVKPLGKAVDELLEENGITEDMSSEDRLAAKQELLARLKLEQKEGGRGGKSSTF